MTGSVLVGNFSSGLNLVALGSLLSQLRKLAKISTASIAKEASISLATVYKVEQGDASLMTVYQYVKGLSKSLAKAYPSLPPVASPSIPSNNPNAFSDLGSILGNIRLVFGITITELANTLGKSPAMVRNVEMGQASPTAFLGYMWALGFHLP